MMLLKNDITHAAGALQLSAGEDAAVEAVAQAMHDTISKENTKAVLLINAENAFSSINRKVILFLVGVKNYLKKGQPSVIQLRWAYAFHQCFTLCLILL